MSLVPPIDPRAMTDADLLALKDVGDMRTAYVPALVDELVRLRRAARAIDNILIAQLEVCPSCRGYSGSHALGCERAQSRERGGRP